MVFVVAVVVGLARVWEVLGFGIVVDGHANGDHVLGSRAHVRSVSTAVDGAGF